MATFQVSKEYVRGQLMSMGIQNISEEDLDAYTRDFSRLVEGHLEHDHSTSSETVTSRQSETPSVVVSEKSQAHLKTHGTSTATSAHHTPVNPSIDDVRQSGSAVFKTFPGNNENRVQFLSPSLSPKLSPSATTPFSSSGGGGGVCPNSSLLSSASSTGSVPVVGQGSGKRRGIKRKVLRRCNGEARVFDESLSDCGSGMGSPSGGIPNLSAQLSNLLVTSEVPSQGNSLLNDGEEGGNPRQERGSHCCRSFIRPPLSHPHTRGLKKADPVTRYHEFRQVWETYKAPGERNRNNLRWHIREQLTYQDVPYYEPRRQVHKPNNFVIPTDKKRSELRWEVRHTLAHQ